MTNFENFNNDVNNLMTKMDKNNEKENYNK